MKIVFLVRSLNYGGTEQQLVQIAKGLRARGLSLLIVVFYKGGALEKDLCEAEVPIRVLGKSGRWDVFGFLWQLIALIRKERPDLIYSLLAVPNILSVLSKLFLPSVLIVWGLRASNVDLSCYDWFVRFSYRLERRLSPIAQLIIVNSRAGAVFAREKGFPVEKMIVIPNGIDVQRFRPEPESGKPLRDIWGVSDRDILVGLVGRLDPIKDHATFLGAAALLVREKEDVRFVCIGEGSETYKNTLLNLSERLGLGRRVIWAGAYADMPAIYNALDIVCSSSFGEGFSNVIGESMACGVPCVVTNVGDSAWIVGGTGEVVPAKDPEAFAAGCRRLIDRLEKPSLLKMEARDRIVQNFSVEMLVGRTCHALEGLGRAHRA